MFTPAIKYGIRIGLVVAITAAILAIFINVQIPAVNFTPVTTAVSSFLAVIYHFVPVMQVIVPLVFVLTGIRLSLIIWKVGSIALKWLWKVNE